MERAIILSDGKDIQAHHIGIRPIEKIGMAEREAAEVSKVEDLSLEEMEKNMIMEALRKSKGNKTEAAKSLHITRRMLYSRMKKYGLQ